MLFYAKYCTTLGELRVYIPQNLRSDVMREFHDKPMPGHLALPAGRSTPIVTNYPNEIVSLDLLGSYPAPRQERHKFILEFTYANRTAVHETTGKTPTELLLGRKINNPISEVGDGNGRSGLGPNEVLKVENNNVVIWKMGKQITVNVDQVSTGRVNEDDNRSRAAQTEEFHGDTYRAAQEENENGNRHRTAAQVETEGSIDLTREESNNVQKWRSKRTRSEDSAESSRNQCQHSQKRRLPGRREALILH
ncbi:hypothetical protein TNCV_1689161 [Trichonephila clavipes]|nr:hypothetical protein TNCV_1689161 [Trichonephila clavipes]